MMLLSVQYNGWKQIVRIATGSSLHNNKDIEYNNVSLVLFK